MAFPRIISIEGNIGSGKSTLLSALKEMAHPSDVKIELLQEPVSEWSSICDKNGTTILEKFYNDQKKYAFSFQMMAYISRLAILKKTLDEHPNAIIITERSLLTDRHVFAKMLYDSGDIEEVDYQIYMRWFDTFAKDYPITGYVYVKTDPYICHERIHKRSRDGEGDIPIEYLKKCHKYHEFMINNSENEVLVLDGNLDFQVAKKKWLGEICEWTFGKKNINTYTSCLTTGELSLLE